MTSRNRERNSVHDRTHTHLRAIQEGQTHQGSSLGELLNDIKTNTSNINLNVDSLEVNTDTLEDKIQTTNDKIDILSGAGNNNIGEGQVKLQIYNYGRDVSAGNYKPMVVDSDGHLQVDSLSSALPTGASTEAKQDVMNTKLDSIETDIESLNTKLDNFSGAGNNNVGEGQTKLQIYNYGRDVSAGNYKPMVVDSDGHLQVDTLSSALPTGASTEAKQDAMNTKLDTISGQLVDDNKSVANAVNSVNTNIITQNTNFHNKVAFLQASVDAESSPPSATTEILLTQDVPMQFKMTALNNSVDAVTTAVNTGNSTLATIDTDTGNLVSLITAGNNIHSANNTLQAGILNGLSGDNSGGGTFAGQNLETIAGRLFDDNKSVATSVNAINTNTISNNTKLTSIDDLALTRNLKLDLTNTKLDTANTNLGTIETDIEATNTKLDSVIGTQSSAYSGKGVILMGKVGDLTSDGQHDATGIVQNDAQFIAVDGAGLVGVTGNFLTENSIELDSGNKTSKTQRVAIATDDIPIALVNTKLDTIASRLIDDSNSVAVSNNAINTNTITTNSKLDDANFNLTANNLLLGGGLPTALNSDQLKVSDSSALTKLGTIDTTLTAIETNVGSNGTLLTSINSRLFDDNKSVANAVNSVNTNIISTNAKLDSLITLLTSLDTKLSASNTSGHYGNS